MKPENVLYTAEGDPLVADLGLAKHFEGDATSTAGLSRSGELKGTAGYAPPEQMNDAKNKDLYEESLRSSNPWFATCGC
jgi:serine/threonine protein kinase